MGVPFLVGLIQAFLDIRCFCFINNLTNMKLGKYHFLTLIKNSIGSQNCLKCMMENEYKENKRNTDGTRNMRLKMLNRRHTDPKLFFVARSCPKFKFIICIIQITEYLSDLLSAVQKYHIIRTISNEFNMETNKICIGYISNVFHVLAAQCNVNESEVIETHAVIHVMCVLVPTTDSLLNYLCLMRLSPGN